MLVRIVSFLIGALLAAGGGYLVWTQRQAAIEIFPAGPEGAPWLLIGGVAAAIAGVVFLANAVIPRPKRAAQKAAQAKWRDAKLGEADSYYSERAQIDRAKSTPAERAADRDWRSGDLPPVARPRPVSVDEEAPQTAFEPAAPDTLLKPAPTPPQLEPLFKSPEPPPPKLSAGKPVATSIPPEAPPPVPFPSTATLAPIPRPAEPPPAPAAAPAPAPEPAIPSQYESIRTAIAEGRLDEADKLLAKERDLAQGEQLAELTGLAGDHAAAAGRQSNAKWLWRLALKRFGECNAMNSPAARAVSERLRLADN